MYNLIGQNAITSFYFKSSIENFNVYYHMYGKEIKISYILSKCEKKLYFYLKYEVGKDWWIMILNM